MSNEDDVVGYDLEDSEHIDSIRKQALECMSLFFCDKYYWAGGSISKSKLYKEEYIHVVLNMTVCDALAVAHYCLKKNKPDTVNTEKKHWDISLCYDCLKQCAKRFIPKCYAGGILLVYLSLCHDVNFFPVLRKIEQLRLILAKKEEVYA